MRRPSPRRRGRIAGRSVDPIVLRGYRLEVTPPGLAYDGRIAASIRPMSPLLDSAATWFLDSATHERDGSFAVRLTEGLKGDERQYVEHEGEQLGPYFPIEVQGTSRCVVVTFPQAQATYSHDEIFEGTDPHLERGVGRFLFTVSDSGFRRLVQAATTLTIVDEGEEEDAAQEYFLRTEDRLFQVASGAPEVELLDEAPRLDVVRTQTWFAN